MQAMATVSNLAKVQGLEWLASLIQQAGSRAVHLVEGTVASLTLIFFRALTLYSGLFQVRVRVTVTVTVKVMVSIRVRLSSPSTPASSR